MALPIAFWLASPNETQPVYGGKPILSYFPNWVSAQSLNQLNVFDATTGAPRMNGPITIRRVGPGGGPGAPVTPGSIYVVVDEGAFSGAGAEAVPWLFRVIGREDWPVTRFYSSHWRRFPNRFLRVLPIPVLASSTRSAAANVLMRIANAHPEETLPLLIAALKTGTKYEREAAARIVGSLRSPFWLGISYGTPIGFRPPSPSRNSPLGLAAPDLTLARPALTANLSYNDPAVQRAAFEALTRLKETDALTFAAMTAYWIRDNPGLMVAAPHVAEAFRQLISRLDPKLRSHLPALSLLRTNTAPLIRIEASYTVWRIDPSDRTCGSFLLGEFARATGERRYLAGDHLARSADSMHIDARQAVPILVAALREQNSSVRARAAAILVHFKSDALPALTDLVANLRDPDRAVRLAAIRAIDAIGPTASNAIPALVLSLNDPAAQSLAARALGKFGSSAASAASKLTEILSNTDQFAGSRDLRSNAARALGQIGLASAPVLTALRTAALESDTTVRAAASEALRQLGQPAR